MHGLSMILLVGLILVTPLRAQDEPSSVPVDTLGIVVPTEPEFTPLSTLQPATDVVYRTATPVNATAAVLLSPVFPGWGQLYSDNGWRAVLAFGTEMWFWSRMMMYDRKAVRFKQYEDQTTSDIARAFYQTQIEEYWELMRDNAWWSGGALLIIAVDAYVDAHLHRFDEDPVPVPNNWEPGDQPQPIELPSRAAPPSMVVFGWSTEF